MSDPIIRLDPQYNTGNYDPLIIIATDLFLHDVKRSICRVKKKVMKSFFLKSFAQLRKTLKVVLRRYLKDPRSLCYR